MSVKLYKDKNWLVEHYIDKRMSLVQCGNLAGCSDGTIQRYLLIFNIPTRSISEANSGEHNPMFGRKLSIETRKKMSISRTGHPVSDETKVKISQAQIGKYVSEGTKQKIREKRKYQTFSDETRRKMSVSHSGPNNPNWRNGSGFEPYCHKFNYRLKEDIRESFNRKCFICGTEESGIKHDVHHVDYNKNTLCNGQSWGLVPLCHSCHSRTNFNRWYWFSLLNNYWCYPYIDGDIFVNV